MNPELARLALRRHLPPGFVLSMLALAVLAATTRWGPPPDVLRDLLGEPDPARVERALARQGVWTTLLLALAPFVVLRSAGFVATWRRGEADWIASSPTGRLPALLSVWIGGTAAALLGVLAAAGVAEVSAGGGPPGLEVAERVDPPGAVLLEPGREEWTLGSRDAGQPGAVLRVRLILVAGGPAADVRLTVARGEEIGETARRIASRAELRVPIPPGAGPARAVFELAEPETIVAIESAEVLRPTASERLVSLRIGLCAGLALAAWLALALGLGAWVSPGSATLGVLAVAAAGWSGLTAIPLPGSDLPALIQRAGEGVVPSGSLLPPGLFPAAGAVLLGLGLGVLGLRSWRSPP